MTNNKQKVTDITAMLLREDGRSMWKRINKVTRAPRTGALMRVEREIDGEIFEFTEEQELIDNIMEDCKTDFRERKMHLSAIVLLRMI